MNLYIYKELLKLNKKKTTQVLKEHEIQIHIFSNEDKWSWKAHEKMFNIIKHKGNANQNHYEIPLLTYQTAISQKER